MSRPKIILDCDPGHDDAIAIIAAARFTELLGITTVSGNAPLSSTTRNALLVTQIADVDVPVHAGADRPLLVPARHATHVHGDSGLDGPDLPTLDREVASNDAVRFIIDTVRSNDDVWLVPIGPMTNIALALRQAPDLVDRVAGLSFMGGSTGPGNVTPSAEFNIWADPHSAAITLSAGIPTVRMAGLNLTSKFVVDRTTAARFADASAATGAFAAEVVEAYVQAGERLRGVSSAMMHDPCAVLAVTHPDLFVVEERHVEVSTEGVTAGRTVVDERGFGGGTTNCGVLVDIDRDAGIDLLTEAIGACP